MREGRFECCSFSHHHFPPARFVGHSNDGDPSNLVKMVSVRARGWGNNAMPTQPTNGTVSRWRRPRSEGALAQAHRIVMVLKTGELDSWYHISEAPSVYLLAGEVERVRLCESWEKSNTLHIVFFTVRCRCGHSPLRFCMLFFEPIFPLPPALLVDLRELNIHLHSQPTLLCLTTSCLSRRSKLEQQKKGEEGW